MPEQLAIARFERRLCELGCPPARQRAKVRELAEHHEDLRRAAQEEGLGAEEALAQADGRLGDPIALADGAVAVLRGSSWWGRHPVIGFCVIPWLGIIPLWIGLWAALCGVCVLPGKILGATYSFDNKTLGLFSDVPALYDAYVPPANFALTVLTLLALSLGLCWMARRAAVGPRWTLAACGFCSCAAYVTVMDIRPRIVAVGWGLSAGWSLQWAYAGVPLAVAAAMELARWRRGRAPAWLPREEGRPFRPAWPRRTLGSSPTDWVTIGLTLVGFHFAAAGLAGFVPNQMREGQWRAVVWPAERGLTMARLKLRQAEAAPPGQTPVDLRSWQNATLLEATDAPRYANGNNLAQLPRGRHVFAGTLFDVEGKIQLAGEPLPKARRKYPARVEGIWINRKCGRLELLHGASSLHSPGRVGRLILHYADGSRATLNIEGGRDVLDWWGPIYQTGAGDQGQPTSRDTELAWAGTNPRIEERSPDASLRLYRTTWRNPHPELEIARLDYVSALSGAGPFLLAVTTAP